MMNSLGNMPLGNWQMMEMAGDTVVPVVVLLGIGGVIGYALGKSK